MNHQNQLQEQKKVSIADYFQQQVAQAVASMPDFISDSEARRLTLNIVVAAQEAIEKTIDDAKKNDKKKPFSWTQRNIPEFVTQIIKHVTAGLDAANSELYVYPYGDKMTIIPSYRGYAKMAIEHSVGEEIQEFLHFIVREGETFKVTYGTRTDEWSYESITFNTGKPLGYITVIVYKDGRSRVMEHTLQDIEKRKQANPFKGSPAWTNWPEEMAIAKAIKRHAKTVNIRLKPEVQEVAEMAGFEEFKDLPVIDLPPSYELEILPEPSRTKKSQRKKAPEKVALEPMTPPAPEPAKGKATKKTDDAPPPAPPAEDDDLDGYDQDMPF